MSFCAAYPGYDCAFIRFMLNWKKTTLLKIACPMNLVGWNMVPFRRLAYFHRVHRLSAPQCQNLLSVVRSFSFFNIINNLGENKEVEQCFQQILF